MFFFFQLFFFNFRFCPSISESMSALSVCRYLSSSCFRFPSLHSPLLSSSSFHLPLLSSSLRSPSLLPSFPLRYYSEIRGDNTEPTENKEKRFFHIKANEAEHYDAQGGEKMAFMATGEHTGGNVSVYHSILPKGNGAPYHMHEIDDELFFIVSGKMKFVVEGQEIIGNEGDMISAGPFTKRKFEALEDSVLVVVNAPAGPSENFLRFVVSLEGPPTEEQRKMMAEKWKIHVCEE